MSTEHQCYSILNQQAAIADYARAKGLKIVRTYADPGRSGLTLAGRPGLRQLLNDALEGATPFSAVLVYDVSRWGRFQDTDESAHYEFLLRRAGLQVVYCAEPFENDGSPYASIVKTIKRTMAGETAREMSVKIRLARAHNAERGYWLGAQVGYGLRRLCVDQDGMIKGVLAERQRKYLQSDHVILAPGPSEETAIVRRAFELFADEGWTQEALAAWLRDTGARRPYGRAWNAKSVHRMLVNEAYVGALVTHKFSCVLGERDATRRPHHQWRRKAGAFEPVIERDLFDRAQQRVRINVRRKTNAELLAELKDLWSRKGRLSFHLVNGDAQTSSPSLYVRRFGSLTAAYEQIGYKPDRSSAWLDRRRENAPVKRDLRRQVIALLEATGRRVEPGSRGRLQVDGSLIVSTSVLTCTERPGRSGVWYVRNRDRQPVDVRIIQRMAPGGREVFDYLILPMRELVFAQACLGANPGTPFDRYVHQVLEPLL